MISTISRTTGAVDSVHVEDEDRLPRYAHMRRTSNEALRQGIKKEDIR